MPSVPEYNDLKVGATDNPGERFDQSMTPGMAGAAGDQLKQSSAAAVDAGNAGMGIATAMQDQANALRVIDAENQARQSALDLANNPQNGYLQLKGKDALNRPNGMALPEEYGEKLQASMDNISGQLSNPMQQRMFHERAADVMTQFQQGVQSHLLQQHTDYGISTLQGATALAQQTAPQLATTDPVAYRQNIDIIKASTAGLQKFTGASADEILAKQNELVGGTHVDAINNALQNNNVDGATKIYNQALSAGELTGKDVLTAQPAIYEHKENQAVMQGVGASLTHFQSQFMPTEMDRGNAAVAKQESGGRDYNTDGTPVTSAKGAKYAMQVMPATAADPGYGIKPAASDTPEEYNRVGKELLGAMMKKYGNPQQAFAAYNAGTEPVDAALATAKAFAATPANKGQPPLDWKTLLPAETQDYITKVNGSYETGSSLPQPPLKSQFIASAISSMSDEMQNRPTAVSKMTEMAGQKYDMMVASRKEQADQALTVAQQQLNQNGGSYTTLPQDTKDNLVRYDASKVDDAMKYAKGIAQGENNTDPAAYAKFVTNPETMKNMTDADWQQQRTSLSMSDFEKLSKVRASWISGKAQDSPDNINQEALNNSLNPSLRAIGINPTSHFNSSDTMKQIGNMQVYFSDMILRQQQQLGRKMTPKEIDDTVHKQFAAQGPASTGFFGGDNTPKQMEMTPDQIPKPELAALTSAFATRGNKAPTDQEMMRAYWGWKGKH